MENNNLDELIKELSYFSMQPDSLLWKAADAITSLKAENKDLRTAVMIDGARIRENDALKVENNDAKAAAEGARELIKIITNERNTLKAENEVLKNRRTCRCCAEADLEESIRMADGSIPDDYIC